jgi:hypothetical protein
MKFALESENPEIEKVKAFQGRMPSIWYWGTFLRGLSEVLNDAAAGKSNSQRSAVGICNHLPSNAAADKPRSGVGSEVRAQAVNEFGRTWMRLTRVVWREGLRSFFVGT